MGMVSLDAPSRGAAAKGRSSGAKVKACAVALAITRPERKT
jgi:hypothetical protein